MTMAHLEKRPVEAETSAKTSEPHPIPQYPPVPTAPLVTCSYELPALVMLVAPPPRLAEIDQVETVRQRHFVKGESSCGHVHQQKER